MQAIDAEGRCASICRRCGYKMNHPRGAGPLESMGWVVVLLGLFAVAAQDSFMSFVFAGGSHQIGLAGGPLEAIRLGSTAVGVAVLFCALIGPVVWSLGMLYVLAGLVTRWPGPATAQVLRLMESLRPWVMLEVFLLGVVVTHGKLAHDGVVGYGRGFYLYLLATGVWFVIAFRVRPDRLWERLLPAGRMAAGACPWGLTGCQTCGLAQRLPRVEGRCDLACVRCHAGLGEDEHAALRRCAALLIVAMLLLWPANFVPIMRIAHLGPPEPATVWGGIKVLYFGGSPVLAALVFAVSLCVPVLKVVVLSVLVLCRSPRRAATARRLAWVHRAVSTAGRWSMVDMFVIALLIGLVRLGTLASVDPKPGAVAFLAVVLLSIVAAEELNAKMFWNHTETRRNG